MKSLLLLRHAHADSAAIGGSDHERPLDPRGQREAAHVCAHLAQRGSVPSLVVCSSARRAVETLELLRAKLPERARVFVEREVYLAGEDQLLERLHRLDDAEDAVLLVGHNPSIGELARALAAGGAADALSRLRSRFPPASLAALAFELESWGELAPGSGRLSEFATPDDLG